MEETITKSVKYIFLDIVRFTTDRSIEAQTEIIQILNKIILSCVDKLKTDPSDTLYMPTGDGMCSQPAYDEFVHYGC
jgi:hypothetical protein